MCVKNLKYINTQKGNYVFKLISEMTFILKVISWRKIYKCQNQKKKMSALITQYTKDIPNNIVSF